MTGSGSRLRKSKTGRKVKVPVTARLRAVLSTICSPWADHTHQRAWPTVGAQRIEEGLGATTAKAGIIDLHFHDLRGTAVTRLSEADCTPQEIARFTGHSLRDRHSRPLPRAD
jgi:integrase